MAVAATANAAFPPFPKLEIEDVPLDSLRQNRRNARTHSKRQIAQLASSIAQFGFVVPIIVADDGLVLAGHGRLAAARKLGLTTVPVIRLSHMTEADRRAYAIADNRLAEQAGWDLKLLGLELSELSALDLGFDVELTGFEGAVLDDLIDGVRNDARLDPRADLIPSLGKTAVTRLGDIWTLGLHRLVCADARDALAYEHLMGGEFARMVFADPPYNIGIDGSVRPKGKLGYREFCMASGELSKDEFISLLTAALKNAADASLDGSIHYVCIDWRHIGEILAAGGAVYRELKNLIVWVKTNAGLGSFYRSQHELIFVFKVGTAPHINTFKFGARYRTNVWTYPGIDNLRAGQDAELSSHPTVKPTAMVADAIKDVSRRGEIVLDPFAGSGTTAIAAEKTGRTARLIEIDPIFCDLICRRWRAFSGQPALLEADGETFEATAKSRGIGGEDPADG